MTQWKLKHKLLQVSVIWVVVLLSSCDREFNKTSTYLINQGVFKDCRFRIIEKYDEDDYQIRVKCTGEKPELYRATYRDLLRLMYKV